MADAAVDNSNQVRSGYDALTNLYQDAKKREGFGDTPSTIKGSIVSKEADEARVQKLDEEFKAALEDTKKETEEGLRIIKDPESLIGKNVVALNYKTVESFNKLIREAQRQIGELGHDSPLLGDTDSLNVLFNLSVMNVGDDDDGKKLKVQAREIIKQIRTYKGGKTVDPNIEKLLFANDAEGFMSQLKSLIRTDGLKALSRENDGSISRKVLKMVKGFGDLQQQAAVAFMGKVDELLSGSPDGELIDNLSSAENDALQALRETISRDFLAISSNEISKKYEDLDSLQSDEKQLAEQRLTKIIQLQKAIAALYTAKNGKEYDQAKSNLAKIHLKNFSTKYKIASELQNIDELAKQLKSIEKSDIPQTLSVSSKLLANSPEDQLDFIKTSYQEAKKSLKLLGVTSEAISIQNDDSVNNAVSNSDAVQRLNELIDSYPETGEKTEIDFGIGSFNNEGEPLSDRRSLETLKRMAGYARAGNPESPKINGENSETERGIYREVILSLKREIAQEKNERDAAEKVRLGRVVSSVEDNLNADAIEKLINNDQSAENYRGLGEKEKNRLNTNLQNITESIGAFTLTLSRQNEDRIDKIKSLANDAKSKFSDEEKEIKQFEDHEFKILYKPLGKNAENIATATRNAIFDFLIDPEDNEFSEDARKLFIKETKDALGKEQIQNLSAQLDSRRALVEYGFALEADQEVESILNEDLLNVGDKDTFFSENGTLSEIITALNDLKQNSDRFGSFFELSRQERATLNTNENSIQNPQDKSLVRANKMLTIIGKLQEISRQSGASDEFQDKVKDKEGANNLFNNLVNKSDELEPIVKRLETLDEQVKEAKSEIKDLDKELNAWSSGRDSEAIFGFKKGGSFLINAMNHFNLILSRMFAHTGESIRKEQSEEFRNRTQKAVEALDGENKMDEALTTAFNRLGTVDTVAGYERAKRISQNIASFMPSTLAT